MILLELEVSKARARIGYHLSGFIPLIQIIYFLAPPVKPSFDGKILALSGESSLYM
jgi:hypothetical protein